jgi:hypothetical protein
MAFGDGVELSYTIRDAKGDASPLSISFPPSTDVIVLRDNFAPTTAELLDPLIDGVIEDANASINVNLDGVAIKTAPIVGADVEEGATFSYRSTAGAPTSMRIPTFDETFGLETGTGVDTANADVAAFIARIVSGDTQGLTTVRFADSHGNNVSAFQKAVDNFRRSRKRK